MTKTNLYVELLSSSKCFKSSIIVNEFCYTYSIIFEGRNKSHIMGDKLIALKEELNSDKSNTDANNIDVVEKEVQSKNCFDLNSIPEDETVFLLLLWIR